MAICNCTCCRWEYRSTYTKEKQNKTMSCSKEKNEGLRNLAHNIIWPYSLQLKKHVKWWHRMSWGALQSI